MKLENDQKIFNISLRILFPALSLNALTDSKKTNVMNGRYFLELLGFGLNCVSVRDENIMRVKSDYLQIMFSHLHTISFIYLQNYKQRDVYILLIIPFKFKMDIKSKIYFNLKLIQSKNQC